MNRNGDAPTVLIFLMALVLVLGSLFTFVSFKNGFGANLGLAEMIYEIDFSEQYIIKQAEMIGMDSLLDKNSDCAILSLNEEFRCNGMKRNHNLSIAGNFFGRLREGDFRFYNNDVSSVVYTFEVKGINVMSNRGASSITRRFDLEIGFDSFGNVVSREINHFLE